MGGRERDRETELKMKRDNQSNLATWAVPFSL